MQIGNVTINRGEKRFCFLEGAVTHGGFRVQVPIHVVNGASNGPTMVVQAGLSGLEIEPAMVLPKVVAELDPAEISGTLVVVPLLNTSGFEFEQINAAWDNVNLRSLGKGRRDGTVSEQMLYRYWEEVVSKANAVIDVRTGALWGYYRYVGVYDIGDVTKSRALAIALGLPQVLIGEPVDGSIAFEAARQGKAVVSVWIGGGPGLWDYGEQDQQRIRAVVLNGMKHLGMLHGRAVYETDAVSVIKAHTILKVSGKRGLTVLDTEKRGKRVGAGEKIGYVIHPFTGEVLQDIVTPREGVMLAAGAVWPVLPEGTTLAILGDLEEVVKVGP